MLRLVYIVLLRLHPRRFQAKFGSEMLLTFEDARATEGSAHLLWDAFTSLLRQHILRSHAGDTSPLPTGREIPTGTVHLTDPPLLGLSPSRLFQGGLVSLALLFTACFCIRGGRNFRGGAIFGQDATARTQPLTPSDLATVHVECANETSDGCSSAAQGASATPDEVMDFQLPIARKRESHELLIPSGPYTVGRILYRWVEDRDLAAGRPQARTRLVFVWYPSSNEPAAAHRFQSVWDYSKANQLFVETHTLERPPVANGSSLFPVLLFYPSMNSSSAAYTTQIENLVSHGYVVASLEPETDRSVVSFSNGQLLPFAADLRKAYRAGNASAGDTLLTRAFRNANARHKALAADLSFVLDKLSVLNRSPVETAPFAGRLDLAKVGALGHSDGGVAAALACQSDQRISACLSEDGWTPHGPNPGATAATVSSKPFLWIDIPLASPGNEQLAYLQMGRTEFDSLARKSEALANQELNSLPGGAYRITVRLPGVTDDYFTDGPFIWSMLDLTGGFTARSVLVIVNTYMRAFFDHYLRGAPGPLLDRSTQPLRNVEVKRYGPAPSHAI